MCLLYMFVSMCICVVYIYMVRLLHSYVFGCSRVFVGISFTVWVLYHVRVIHNGYVVLEFIQGVFSGWVC